MELLKFSSGKGVRFGDALHVLANVGFVGLIALVVFIGQLPLLALVLVLVSKWRIFAVRPRFWSINLRANLLDIIFIVSVVSLAIHPAVTPLAQAFWLLVLAVWQVVLKQLSGQSLMVLQAALGQFVGLMALLAYAAYISVGQLYMVAIVIGAWGIGYAAARHIMASYDHEPKTEFFGLLWGFVVAQLTWLLSHWLQVYVIIPGVSIPQIALIVILLGFAAWRVYAMQRYATEHDDLRFRKKGSQRELRSMYVAILFTVSLLLVILLTNSWTIAI